jgi:hypothetical protein
MKNLLLMIALCVAVWLLFMSIRPAGPQLDCPTPCDAESTGDMAAQEYGQRRLWLSPRYRNPRNDQ